MENKLQTTLMGAAGAMLLFAACTSDSLPEVQNPSQAGNVGEVLFVTCGFQRNGVVDSRTSIAPMTDGATFAWVNDDIIGVLPDEGSQVYFVIDEVDDKDASKATFTGGAWGLKAGHDYAAYYPYIPDINLDRTAIPVDYTGQVHTGVVTMDGTTTQNMSRYDYMAAKSVQQESGALNFEFSHLGALMEVKVAIPTAGSVNRLILSSDSKVIPLRGTFDLTAGTMVITSTDENKSCQLYIDVEDLRTTEDDETVSIFFMMPPIPDVNISDLTATVLYGEDNKGIPLDITTKGTLEAGKYYTLEHQTITLPEAFVISDASAFAAYVNEALNLMGGTKLRFVAGSAVVSGKKLESGDLAAYAVRNGDWLEIHTLAKAFKLPKDCSNMFNSSSSFSEGSRLTEMDLRSIDTSLVTNMSYMFYNCSSLTSLDLSNFNTSKVTNMNYMFYNCSSLTSLDLSNFTICKIYDFIQMFYNVGSSHGVEIYVTNSDYEYITEYAYKHGCGIDRGYAILVIKE